MLKVDYVRVGQKIKEKRLQNDLTREQLAELCELSASYIAHIERGTKSKICRVLNVSLDYLLLDEIQSHDRIFTALGSEVETLPRNKQDKFIKFARLILKNIDEL